MWTATLCSFDVEFSRHHIMVLILFWSYIWCNCRIIFGRKFFIFNKFFESRKELEFFWLTMICWLLLWSHPSFDDNLNFSRALSLHRYSAFLGDEEIMITHKLSSAVSAVYSALSRRASSACNSWAMIFNFNFLYKFSEGWGTNFK